MKNIKASVVSVLRICTQILYTSYEIEASYFVYTTGGFNEPCSKSITVCARLMALCPYRFQMRTWHAIVCLRQHRHCSW